MNFRTSREMQTSFAWISFFTLFLSQLDASQFLEKPCGTPNVVYKIVNGADARRQEAAWMAAIDNGTALLCGGTLIHRRFVLTAAHCIVGQKQLQVKLGAYNQNYPTVVSKVIKGIPHELFKGFPTYENDIGLLKLSSSVVYNPNIIPICIILNKNFKTHVDKTKAFKAYGWGQKANGKQSDILQTVILNREDPSNCYMSFAMTPTSNQICGRVFFGDTCAGDSGGPLVNNVTIKGIGVRAIQLGIVSYGDDGCNGLSVYTDVTSYVDWIDATIKKNYFADESQAQIGLQTPKVLDKWLYSDCGGDTIASNLLANIYGLGFIAQGVLITDQFVITNAKGLGIPVSLEVSVIGMQKRYKSYRVVKIFTQAQANNDIALLKLNRPVTGTDGMKPICMLANLKDQQEAESSNFFTVFDYVNTYTGLNIFDFNVFPIHPYYCSYSVQRIIETNQLCVRTPQGISQNYGKPGDILGKKISYKGKERFVLYGILSYSYNGVHIYTNVMAQTKWIAKTVKLNQ
ncbi:venom prothrombin activator oscutarin-C catalytic subunit-like isoform X2 [Drosophila subpulchrella]|uniref:venom prothrombin activator oscutarin-C catalytic subunit-like isoform X2 n=1 Tax=Drosophila subpulchrella TaxID=1486046 RepID=UPI0018A17F72|nr:venom prothrombin activator oscutarin-C catalytic subunit-like isoform X2 [Drosophila subpulchrella]